LAFSTAQNKWIMATLFKWPSDNVGYYVAHGGSWTNIGGVPIAEAPNDGAIYSRGSLGWHTNPIQSDASQLTHYYF
jgi:hypothetical protein